MVSVFNFIPNTKSERDLSEHGELRNIALKRSNSLYLVLIALVLAVVVRSRYQGSPDFPLGEGGLFVHFAEMIIGNGFMLPVEAHYGGVTLPFAYPPLAFYLAAFVSRITGLNLNTLFYWLPILFNLLAIPAFCFLTTQVTKDRVAVAAATLLYAVVPQAFLWQITGGGLPRAAAALLAMLAVALAFRDLSRPSLWRHIGTGALVGLTILTHLEWGILATVGVVLAFATSGNLRRMVPEVIIIGLVAALVISPWLGQVIANHGLSPFLSSSSSSQWDIGEFLAGIATGSFFGLLAWPAVLGAIVSARRKEWFLLLWTLSIMILTPRMGASAGATIPLIALAGLGVSTFGAYIKNVIDKDPEVSERGKRLLGSDWVWGQNFPSLAALTTLSIVLVSPAATSNITTLKQLSSAERAGMAWVHDNTPRRAKFVVVSDAKVWWEDRIAEWFPVLTRRTSITTAQGLEWAGVGVFTEKKKEINQLKMVQIGGPNVLPQYVSGLYCGAYVAIFSSDYRVRHSFEISPSFITVYSNNDALVLKPTRSC